ncbi:MAG: ABC transporter ATP-binding protein [Gammaproteobacteria bacterium]
MQAYSLAAVQHYYPGSTAPALHIDALNIPANRVTALIGPNGAGKSTLLQMLAFAVAPGRGEIRFQDQAVDMNELLPVRRRVALVPQNPYLLHMSVAANIEIGLKLRGMPAAQRRVLALTVMEQLNIAALATRPAQLLSGGEAQKVALARALVLEPEVLLFDEPFTYLDKTIVHEFEQLIMTIRENRAQTIIFSSHDQLRATALADEILTLLNGRLAPTSLVNHFQGCLDSSCAEFDTGRIIIHVAAETPPGEHLAVAANQIALSRAPLESSMRNSLSGRITGLHESHGQVRVSVQAGELFQVIITRQALAELQLHLGEEVYMSFKSSAVTVF